MAIEFERKRRPMQEINLTALIDIVFHLMVFVMVTTTFVVSESMELSLPAGKQTAASTAQVMRIQIAGDGGLFIDQYPTPAEGLSAILANRLGDNPEIKIAIFTMPGVTVQQLVKVMDTVYLSGGRNVQVDKAG